MPLVDRPLHGRREGPALASIVGAEDADRDDLGGRRDGRDDPGAGRPVADEVGGARVIDDAGVVAVEVHAQASRDAAAERRVIRIDARIDDGDGDAAAIGVAEHLLAIQPAERPFAREPVARPDANASLQAGTDMVIGRPAGAGDRGGGSASTEQGVQPVDRQLDRPGRPRAAERSGRRDATSDHRGRSGAPTVASLTRASIDASSRAGSPAPASRAASATNAPRSSAAASTADRRRRTDDRGRGRHGAGHLEVAQGERAATPVEHLEHPERPVGVGQRGREHGPGNVARRVGDRAVESGVGSRRRRWPAAGRS